MAHTEVVGGVSYLVSYGDQQRSPAELQCPSPERVEELRAMPYKEYLGTLEWREKRRIEIQAAEYQCQKCGRTRGLEVHHLTYERRGAESPDDLQVLCRVCHTVEHRA